MKESPQASARRVARLPEWPLVLPVGLMALQVVAAAFFVADGFEDWLVASTNGPRLELAMECVIAVALLTGVILSS